MMRQAKPSAVSIDAAGKSSSEINRAVKELIAAGHSEIEVLNTAAQHNLAVGLTTPVSIAFQGSAGYYCGGLIDGPRLEISGSAGWGLAESMLNGQVVVQGHAGNSCAASIRGGTVVVHGNVAARAAVAMKGGLLLVAGDCDYMAGFMMQKGTMIVCGNAGPALGDSMYEGCIYVGGTIEELGNDAVIQEPSQEEWTFLRKTLEEWKIESDRPFRKVVAGRKLWNFDKQEIALWKEAL